MDINKKISLAAEMACLLEVSVEKPGNVTPQHDFSDTKYEDFLISAAAIRNAFTNASGSSVGEIIVKAVKDTKALTKTNTNLGIILLLAPLARAFTFPAHSLRNNLKSVLQSLTIKDAELAYKAIRLAAPGGMGRVSENDINDKKINITLIEAMEQAKDRDSIAGEYASGYEITLDIGLPVLRETLKKEISVSDAIVQTFLTILSQVPDTLISRKKGKEAAKNVSDRADAVLKSGGIYTKKGREEINALDLFLRKDENSFTQSNSLNPGTTADLAAAVLFVYLMENELKIVR